LIVKVRRQLVSTNPHFGADLVFPTLFLFQFRAQQTETVLEDLSGFFKLSSDKTRIGILWVLSLSEMCVCDLALLLKMKQPAISQHLKNLHQMRIVRTRREGKVIYYSLDDDHNRTVLNTALKHIDDPVGTIEALS
jgi:ArsR family transcriptional regulator, lead/cadmium/zinc/bismuth-responsive transcriptional repressor